MSDTTEIFGSVGPQTLSDGLQNPFRPRQGRSGEQVVTELHGKYYEATKRGKLFLVSTPAAGVTVPIYTGATQQFGLYNPSTSGVDLVLLKAYAGYVSGTMVAGHLCYAMQAVAAAPGTVTAAYVKNAKSTPAAGNMGLYYSPLTPAVQPVTTDYLRAMGNNQAVQTAATANAPWNVVDDIDGSIIVSPGSLFLIAANVAAAMVSVLSVLLEEVPI